MATALRINADLGPPGSPPERIERKPTGLQDGNNDKRNSSVLSDKYIHVHHYLDTGRWGTWFNDPTLKRGSGKRRLYFGTYETEYLAARAQDRAALKFKSDAVRPTTRLNFAESDYELDQDLRDQLTHEQFRRLLMAESRKCYKRAEPSPCWKIFLEEEAARGKIHIEHESRSNRYQRKPRAFTDVLEEIVSKNEAVAEATEETTEPINGPVVVTGEEVCNCKVYTSKRIKHPTQDAPDQPAQEVTKELVAEDPAAVQARSLSAPRVRSATPVAPPPVRHETRSASLNAPKVRRATPMAAPPGRLDTRSARPNAPQVLKAIASPKGVPPVRRDAKSASLSARPVRKANHKAAPPVRGDTRSASLSAPPKATVPVLRRDTRIPCQIARPVRESARPVREGTPEPAPPVRRELPMIKRGVRPVEGEGRSALQSQPSPVYLWGQTRGRSARNFNRAGLPNAGFTDESTVAAESEDIVMVAANILSEVPNGTSGTADGKVDLGNDRMHTTAENPNKRRRLSIDLNREPEPSSTADAVAPQESGATGRNDDPEVSSVKTLLLLKAGWLN